MESKYEKLKDVKQQIKYRLQNDDLDGIMFCDLQQTGDEESSVAMIVGANVHDLAVMVHQVIKKNPEIIPVVVSLLLQNGDREVTFDFGGQVND